MQFTLYFFHFLIPCCCFFISFPYSLHYVFTFISLFLLHYSLGSVKQLLSPKVSNIHTQSLTRARKKKLHNKVKQGQLLITPESKLHPVRSVSTLLLLNVLCGKQPILWRQFLIIDESSQSADYHVTSHNTIDSYWQTVSYLHFKMKSVDHSNFI